MNVFSNRVKTLQSKLSPSQAALVTDEISIFYFTGFPHSEGYFFATADESYLLVDFRYIEAAENTVKTSKVVIFSNPYESVNELISANNISEILLESEKVTLSDFNAMQKNVNAKLIDSNELSSAIKELRIIKTDDEVEKLKKAQDIAEKAYLEVLNIVKPGITEREIALELEYLMKKNGAEKIAFDLITVTGKKTSLPHGVPADVKVQNGDFVTFDIGAVYEGYHSDMTRTIAVGEVSEEQKKIYDIVLKAHLEGLNAVKAGVSGFEVDKVCRDIITEAGYGEYFGHGTGHGVGLEIHEEPRVSPKGNAILESGMVITVEPGIYLPDKFGVRIEDTVLVTEDGYETFAHIPKELIIL
ncbi:MAG: aminopeptidase P family protein [Ruminococcus sp.]|nr:aminopeptidase P family protein [Ruminococcus sp.]